jgi:hypothetical protein
VEALEAIITDTQKWLAASKELEPKRVKACVFIFNKCIRDGNFQIYSLELDLLNLLLSAGKPVAKGSNLQTGELKQELEKSVNEVFLKMGQGQQIK